MYVVPPRFCGEIALTEFVEPTMTVRVNGVVEEDALTDELQAGGAGGEGEDDRLRVEPERRGGARPQPSVAVSRSSRYEGYSWSGAAKEPPATPVQDWSVCVWQFEGQCCMSSVQESAEAASAPCSGSLACPVKRS